jgi:hypothetical protein
MKRLAVLAFGFLIGCGAGFADDDDDVVATDAGGADAPHYCQMQASVAPLAPEAPVTLVVTAVIEKHGVFGLETYGWAVDRSAVPIDTELRDPDGVEIQFEADVPGPYRVVLTGSVGGEPCIGYTTVVNVTDPAANEETYRLKLVPRPDQPAPPQVQTISVPGGANFDVGARDLESGLLASGILQAPGGGTTGGYLRAMATADPVLATPQETFAAGDGSFQLRVLAGEYELLVVPAGNTIAPVLFTALDATELTGALALPAADAITGTVQKADASPAVGVRVALTVGGVPSTIATTDAAGAFSLLAHAGGATALTVAPADGMLPQLDLDVAAGLVAASAVPLAIRYAASTDARTESFTAVAADGSTPVPAAVVTFIARSVAGAGTVTPQGSGALDASGTVLTSAIADSAGLVVSVRLPPAVYDVVVAPPAGAAAGETARIIEMDLTGGAPAPATLALAAPATVRADVSGAAAGTRVTAVPRGALARASSAATVESEIVAPGKLELELVGGGEYDVAVHARAGSGRAPVRFAVTAPAPGVVLDLEPIALPAAIQITGTVESTDIAGDVSGVTIVLLCGECTGEKATVPIAETVSGAGGAFTLLVPDPGTAE